MYYYIWRVCKNFDFSPSLPEDPDCQLPDKQEILDDESDHDSLDQDCVAEEMT